LSGAPFGLCFAFCALDCDQDPRFPCGILNRLFHRFAGDTPLTCEPPPALTLDACSDFSGRAGRVCRKACKRCDGRETSSSCRRLTRQFGRLTGGAALPCGA
jgi:hypothetical protein